MIQKILFISIFLGLWSCNKINDTVSTDNDNLSVRLTMSNLHETESRSDYSDASIADTYIMLFDENGLLELYRFYDKCPSEIIIDKVTSGKKHLYIIANVGGKAKLTQHLNSISSIAEIESLHLELLTESIIHDGQQPLPMAYYREFTLPLANKSIVVDMTRQVAKLIFVNDFTNGYVVDSIHLEGLTNKVSLFAEKQTINKGASATISFNSSENSTTTYILPIQKQDVKYEIIGKNSDGVTQTYKGEIDRTLLKNQSYRLSLSTGEISDNGSPTDLSVNINSKLGHYSPSDSTLTLYADGGSFDVTVGSYDAVSSELSDSWVSNSPPTKAFSKQQATLSFTAEPFINSDDERSAYLLVKNSYDTSKNIRIKIKQQGENRGDKYLVIAVAGQSNAVGYDESAVYPIGIHAKNPNAFQLSYGRYGVNNLEIVPLTWNSLNIEDNTKYTNVSGLKGTKGIQLPLANELSKLIPTGYKLLFVNVAYTGSAFVAKRGESMDYDAVGLKPRDMTKTLMWGENTPYHKTLVSRIKYALDLNSQNKFIGVVWCQGEADALYSDSHFQKFTQMTNSIFDDLNRNNFGDRCPKGVADKDMWYNFSTTNYFVDWYDKQNAAPVFGGYKMWNPNTFIHIPRNTANNSVGGNGVTGAGKYHFGNDTYRTVIAPAVAKCIDDNGGLFNGKSQNGKRFGESINLEYANTYGGKLSDTDVSSSMVLHMPLKNYISEKLVGNQDISSTSASISATSGLKDINGNARTMSSTKFNKSSKVTINKTEINNKYSIAFMLRRTGSVGNEVQTFLSSTGSTIKSAPFLGFKTYASGQRTANITEFAFEPLYTGQKLSAVPGMLLEADNVTSLNDWIHYVVTYDFLTKQARVYMNGQEVQMANIPSSITPSLSRIVIGMNSSTVPGIEGEMFDLIIWNKIIDPATVKKIFLYSYYGFTK